MGVSKNMGTPKWMVKIMENPTKMDDLGVPLFSETSIYIYIPSWELTYPSSEMTFEYEFLEFPRWDMLVP